MVDHPGASELKREHHDEIIGALGALAAEPPQPTRLGRQRTIDTVDRNPGSDSCAAYLARMVGRLGTQELQTTYSLQFLSDEASRS